MDSETLSLRARRLKNEWQLLNEIALFNPGLLHSLEWTSMPPIDTFSFRLTGTTALVERVPGPAMVTEHAAELRFPRFFPAVPMELYLQRPAFHPNIDPLNGFVCLWDRHATRYTVAEALIRLQGILTCRLFNFEAAHMMQPAAAEYYRTSSVPLECRDILLNPEWGLRRETGRLSITRKRLSDYAES